MRPDFNCVDCGIDVLVINEYSYMVTDKVWEDADMPRPSKQACEIACLLFEAELISKKQLERHLDSGGKLCIECLEKRIGRELTVNDFNLNVPITIMGATHGSDRLRDRLKFF